MGSDTFTVPELARAERIGETKIRAFIESGELRAVNLALRAGQRPRWKIAADDWHAFLARRSNAATARSSRRHRPAPVNLKNVTQFI